MAAASIGQVHRAILKSTGKEVAVKVQFPGIHDSITSDLNNISLLLRTSAILPRGLYLNNTISVFRGELADECDYVLEAENQRKMKRFLEDQNEQFFEVPAVIDELSTMRVLTTEIQPGKPLSQIKQFDQALRDKVSLVAIDSCPVADDLLEKRLGLPYCDYALRSCSSSASCRRIPTGRISSMTGNGTRYVDRLEVSSIMATAAE